MKKILYLFLLLVLFASCSRDEKVQKTKAKVENFTIEPSYNQATVKGTASPSHDKINLRIICQSLSSNARLGFELGKFSKVNIQSVLTGLIPATTYTYRLEAYTPQSVALLDTGRFSTKHLTKPTVTTRSVSNITTTTASSGGNVTDLGDVSLLARGVCWNTSPSPTVSNSHTNEGGDLGDFASSITGLTPGVTYYVRAYAKNSVGTSYGNQVTFTSGSTTPTVNTSDVTSITSNSAVCGGNVTTSGGAPVTARGLCWGTSFNPSTSNSHNTIGQGTGVFSGSMTGLASNTTYHVRAYATNSKGTAYGQDVVFTTTSALPTVTTGTVSDISYESAKCTGNVTNTGGANVTLRGICWGTTSNPTTSNSSYSSGSGTGSFTGYLNRLTPGTTYYIRAFATNNYGTAYGEQRTITTLPIPTGAISGQFTVSSGHKVFFSRGNLQYTTTGSHTVYGGGTASGTWRFASTQFDYLGDANSSASSTYTGWIDLFGWGTSGWSSGATAYQPYATSSDTTAYCPGGSTGNNLTGTYARADWGIYNAISNGGNQPNRWRTLTGPEWNYLLYTRSASSWGGVSNARFAKVKVNGVNGLLLFPDSFTPPSGVSAPAYINNQSSPSSWSGATSYTTSQFNLLQNAGCVFLPTAGYRSGTSITANGGCYWASTYYSAMPYRANGLYVLNNRADVTYFRRRNGLSVRLVQDAN